jgi:hypothetical protein
VRFFDDSISYFVSHLRSVRKYLDVFAIVFVKRSGRFRSWFLPNALSLTSNCLPLTGFQGGLSYLGTIFILLMSIYVSPRYSAVLINRGSGFLGLIVYSSSLFGFMNGVIGWSAFVSIRIADFVLFHFLISSNFARPASHRRFYVLQITKVPRFLQINARNDF